MEKQQYIEAGKIVNTHGIAGEVRIEVWLDSPAFFKRFKTLYMGARVLKVSSARIHKDYIIAKLEGVDDINAAMPLKGKVVSISRDDPALPAGTRFIQDILGARVVDESGKEIGILKDVMETPANMIYVVKGETEHLIPAVPEFLLNTDADAGVITVRLIEGM